MMTPFYLSPGLDDLRDWTNNVQSHIPIYVPERDFEVQTSLSCIELSNVLFNDHVF